MKHHVSRYLDLNKLLAKKSYILLGPRQTGKSTLIREQLKNVKKYNLLLNEDFKKLSFNPACIREEWTTKDKIIVIDEIQKLPQLLDEVHYLIEEKGVHFLLTGSSARKLQGKGVNTLGGRARVQHFHTLTYQELGKIFDLDKAVYRGLLPSIYFSEEPLLDLESYVSTYLQQEIANEGLVRSLPSFSRFIEVAATCHAEQINFTGVSNDAQIARTTVHDYFQVLKDTLVSYELGVWGEGKKRKPIATSKFYFFDWGVAKTLLGIKDIQRKNPLFGKAFESILFQELYAYSSYKGLAPLKYWRTVDKKEVDFIIDDHVAVEVKAKTHITKEDLSGLLALKEEKKMKEYLLVYLGNSEIKKDVASGIRIVPYAQFLNELWAR